MVSKEYRKNCYEKNKAHILQTMSRLKYCDHCEKNIKFSVWNKHCNGKKHKELEEKANIIKVNKVKMEDLQKQMEDLKSQLKKLSKNE